MTDKNNQALWIWPKKCGTSINQYVEFRHEFEVSSPASALLVISVDSNYALRLNDEFVEAGQYADYPRNKVFDTLPVEKFLRPGKNVLSIVVYYQGQSTAGYLNGDTPGLLYELTFGEQKITSGTQTQYRPATAYRTGPMPKITGQLGFGFFYDATKETPSHHAWTSITSQDIDATCQDRSLRPRPIAKLTIGDRIKTRICAQGVFRRAGEKDTLAASMQTDFFSTRTSNEIFAQSANFELPGKTPITIAPPATVDDGTYLILDLGREEAGFFDLEIDASAGTVIDIANGEHLDDLRVRAFVGGRNFAYQYICKQGRQRFTHYFRRLAGRYLQLQFRNISQPLQLYYAGLLPTDYPLDRKGGFTSCDSLLNQIYETSVRTLRLCMHEHYEDCPWREQALYTNDSRNQALCGYYAFGEYDFPAASFDLLVEGLKDDGYLELCAPADIPITIPSFSLAWILEVADHWQFRADLAYVQKQYPRIKKMLQKYLPTIRESLLPCPQGKRYWHFYDWAENLAGSVGGDCTAFGELKWTRFDAPLNALFVMALDSAAKLAVAAGNGHDADDYKQAAEKLRAAFHDRFWDANESAYFSYADEKTPKYFAELTQSLVLLAGLCPKTIAAQLRSRLASENNGLTETTLSQSFYKFEALMAEKEIFGKRIFDLISRDWSKMLFAGATSFWETMKGGWDFDNAGSLCHGWSAIPVYFYQAYALGVRPIDPGFKTFLVDPLHAILPTAKGKIPTPAGEIEVSLEQRGDRMIYRLTHPVSLTPKLINFDSKDELIIQPHC
jgi:hypothetical protein